MKSIAYMAIAILLGGTTFPLAFAQTGESSPPLTLTTADNSLAVLAKWTPKEIEPGMKVDVSLEFLHPFAMTPLSHVNYNLTIVDENGVEVESLEGLHSHIGQDVQTVTFDKTGNFKLMIEVLGTGIDPPFDKTRSGTVEAAVMVVPEFPVVPAVLAAATGLAIVSARLKFKK